MSPSHYRTKFGLSMVLGLASVIPVLAQTGAPVNLRGKVTGISGSGIAGAEVTLVGRNLKDTTDASGNFTIASTATALFAGPRSMASRHDFMQPAMRGAKASQAISAEGKTARTEWFRLDGRMLRQEHTNLNPNLGQPTSPFALAKQQAIIDSLKVVSLGFTTTHKTIESYDAEVNITLQSAATVECNPADRTPAPTVVNTTFSGATFTGPHQVVVETDPGMPGVTIFRPKELGVGKNYPITAWGQGGCSKNGLSNREFQAEIASHGYVVFSDGTPNGTGSGSMTNDIVGMGKPLVDYIKFAIKENNRPCSPYYRSLDTTKTAAFGWSCGGLMAEGAAASNLSALSTFMVLNSGMTSLNQSVINAFKVPMLVVVGGESDQAYPNGTRDYEAVQTLPAVWMSSNVGHGGTYSQDNGGAYAQVCVNWMNWWLKGDTGPKGKGYFVGANCGLCSNATWTLKSKNIP